MANPSDFASPGQLIEALLEERGWTRRVLAVVMGVDDSAVNRRASDERPIDAAFAINLESIFGVSAEEFLRLQQKYDLGKARLLERPDPKRATRAQIFGGLPVSEMIKRGWIAAESVRDPKVEPELARFFGVSSIDDIEILPHAAKKTEVAGTATPAQLAWIYRVRQIAEELLVPRFTAEALRAALPRLRELLRDPELARHVPRVLMECGIRFVIAEGISDAKIDGVTFWIKDSPVVGMSIRFDRIDNFWFVLRHELEHVLHGHGRDAVMLDSELEGERAGTGPTVRDEERIANLAAADFCVPAEKLRKFILLKAPLFSERDLLGFARTVGVHPGLVAGQVRHATGRFNLFAKHLVKVRNIVTKSAIVDGWGDVAQVDTN